ncbi:MAG: hypothetical protein WB868_03200 [Xanthobacteraceae bacterium]
MPPRSPSLPKIFIDAYRDGLGARAAARLSEAEICRGAADVAVRVDAEMARLQAAGGLKSVNTSYRQYRLQTTARSERVMRYADWMDRYKADLIREIAANLR